MKWINRKIVLSLLLVLTVQRSDVFADEPSTQPGQNPDVLLEHKPVVDDKSKLEIRMPKGWVLKKGIQDTGYEAPKKDRVAAGGLAPSIILSKSDAPGIKPKDIDEVIKAKKAQYAKLFAEYAEQSSGSELPKFNGKGVGVIEFGQTLQGVLRIREKQVWIIADDTIYIVTCASLDDTFSDNEKLFDAALKTLVVP